VSVRLLAIVALVALPHAAVEQRRATPAPAREPVRERTVPFAAGELLTYDVSWSNFLTAGSATVAVKEKRPSNGSVAYEIIADGRPTSLLSRLYKLYYKAETLLDAYTLLPQRSSVYSEEGRRTKTKLTTFDHRRGTGVFEVQPGAASKKDMTLPPDTLDALGVIFVLRASPLKTGTKMTLHVANDGEILNVEAAIGRRERVQTGIGSLDAFRITPAIVRGEEQARAMTMWISDDQRRLPVKLEAELPVGSFVLTLTSAKK
jgi:uncharacterized protein DUF3108